MTTKNQKCAADVATLLRARTPLFWVVTREELRVERLIVEAAASVGYEPMGWDCAAGLTDAKRVTVDQQLQNPSAVVRYIDNTKARRCYVLRDADAWLKEPVLLRAVKNLAQAMKNAPRNEARSIVILSSSSEVPPPLKIEPLCGE